MAVPDLTSRLKAILAVFIVAILVTGGFTIFKLVSYFSAKPLSTKTPPVFTNNIKDTPSLPVVPAAPAGAPTPIQPQPAALQESQKADLITIVVPFVERFGSFSNQSNYQNLEDLQPFMTPTMKTWAEEKIRDARSKAISALYRGVTTKVLSYIMTSFDDAHGTAEFKITVQRKELVGTETNFKVYNQDIVVQLSKVEGVWLVNSAQWQ